MVTICKLVKILWNERAGPPASSRDMRIHELRRNGETPDVIFYCHLTLTKPLHDYAKGQSK
jgi:hypothetical protein